MMVSDDDDDYNDDSSSDMKLVLPSSARENSFYSSKTRTVRKDCFFSFEMLEIYFLDICVKINE
jgi:hypothetical protein